jgi:hypothetical protein
VGEGAGGVERGDRGGETREQEKHLAGYRLGDSLAENYYRAAEYLSGSITERN